MNRRHFILKSAFFLMGGVLGFNPFISAFGQGNPGHRVSAPARIALIIDDIGHSMIRARQFLNLNIPLTFSVLPRLAFSRKLAVEMHCRGHEIMLHQPMEPYDNCCDPGPGALYVGDGDGRINQIMEENITEIPYAVGVNNHMGSRFTSSQKEIRTALRVVKNQGLFFVDSLTSSHSKAFRTARNLRISSACRNIFLDNSLDETDILCQLARLKSHAIRYGRAVGIGHPFPETARAIARFLEAGEVHNLQFTPASSILSA